MVIDRETFTEMASHLARASESIVKAAQYLAALVKRTPHEAGDLNLITQAMLETNQHLVEIERRLRAVMEANNVGKGQNSKH